MIKGPKPTLKEMAQPYYEGGVQKIQGIFVILHWWLWAIGLNSGRLFFWGSIGRCGNSNFLYSFSFLLIVLCKKECKGK